MDVVVVVGVVSSVVAPEELELLDESSFFEQEMIVRLKQEIRKTNKNFFIFSSIPKLKSYWLREPYIYHDLEDFTRIWGFYLEVFLTVEN